MGIKERILSFYGEIEYYGGFMEKLAILKVYMGTLEIFPNYYIDAPLMSKQRKLQFVICNR
jgi:hypothetical protein